jgi:hypothetical protein
MRLYPRRPDTGIVQHGGVTYGPADDGGFDFPDPVSDQLHSFAVKGERLWETGIERQRRILGEELDRRRDPASLYEAVAKLVQAAETVTPEPAKPSRAKAATAK